jgi:hypothetical protein
MGIAISLMLDMKVPRMTPRQRVRAAQNLHKRAISAPGLKIKQRQNLRRIAANLMVINILESKQARSD